MKFMLPVIGNNSLLNMAGKNRGKNNIIFIRKHSLAWNMGNMYTTSNSKFWMRMGANAN